MKRTTIWTSALLALAFVGSAQAVTLPPLEASDNATVQPGGPRSGSSGKAFFNMEGSANGNFSSFGVAEFDLSSLVTPGTVVSVDSATLTMTQSNAAFTESGPISIYVTQQNGVGIQPGDAVNYILPNDGAAAVDADLLPLSLVGSGNFVELATGQVDTYSLTFSGATLTYLLNQINSDGKLRLVLTPDAASTAATYAGSTNSSWGGPTLNLDVSVPEPGSILLALVGGVAALGLVRRGR